MSRILKLLPPEQNFGEEYKKLHFPKYFKLYLSEKISFLNMLSVGKADC